MTTVQDRSSVSRPVGAGVAAIETRSLSMDFATANGPLSVLREVSIGVEPYQFVSIIGPSGCGKTTLFNILAGLDEPAEGEIRIGGRPAPDRLGHIGYMPQKDLLLPWKTVLDNTVIGLELLGVSRREARAEARPLFRRFGLEGFEGHYPATLSGGMRQRAALLRTFLARREVLLLDEPFGALDALTRADMQEWLLEICGVFRKTVLFITHDVDEAIYLSDRVYVMTARPGTMQACIDVNLPQPRSHDDAVTSDAFVHLKSEILHALRLGRGSLE